MSETFPRALDVRKLAEAGTVLTGNAAFHQFPRLAQLATESQADAALLQALSDVQWTAQFNMQRVAGAADVPALNLQVSAQLALACQRCITPYAQDMRIDRSFVFAADEASAELLDEDSEDDVLVSSRQFDLMALMEDELLLDMPIVPMHDQCPQPVVMQAGEVAAETEKPNPFAALAALKTGKPPTDHLH